MVLGPSVLAAALWLPTGWLGIAMAPVVLLGAWEWTTLAGITGPAPRLGYLGVVILGFVALWQVHIFDWGPYVLAPVAMGWVGLSYYLTRVEEIRRVEGADIGVLGLGLPVLLGPWLAMLDLDAIQPDGPLFVLCLLLLIWGADIAAYFAGRQWGRAKLAPVLSPGKTRAGAYAALAAAAGCGVVFAALLGLGLGLGLALVLICVVTTVVSVAGDLFESLLKRRRGLKDSGGLLPGHGGILDRIDSMTAAAPVFTLGLRMLL